MAGLIRIEHEVKMPIKSNAFSLKSVSVVGEKAGGYFRFLHAENQQAVVATEDLDEAIRLCLARFNVVSVKKVETD